MEIKVSDKIYIKGADKGSVGELKKALEIPNPAFRVMLRKFGRRVYHMKAIKQKFCYYEYIDDTFSCGRGNLKRLKKYFNCDIEEDFTDKNLKKPLKFKGELRDYQAGVVETIIENGNNGIIKLGTGFGKTIIACELIRKLNKTALIIVPRVSLLNQFRETLKEFYDYEAGIIQGKTWDIRGITVASASTLKTRDLSEIKTQFGILLADECHTIISDKGVQMVQSFNPTYLYGLSATPKRSDQQGKAIFFTFGGILIDKALPHDKLTVEVINSNVEITGYDYHEMVEDMVNNQYRNLMIASKAKMEIANNRKILILTKRIGHYKKLWEYLVGFKIYAISSDTKQSDRDILLTKLRNNEKDFDMLLGTYSMLSTGVDIPSLDTLIFVGDIKSDVLCEQSIGRILRIFNGKMDPKIIDIHDNLHGIFHRQFLARRRFYKENKWKIL